MSCSSTSTARRSASRRATACRWTNGCATPRRRSLAQFMFNAPQRAKRLYFDVIPRAVDEYIANAGHAPRTQIAAEQQTNPAWHIHGGRLPNHAGSPISFAMLLNLASVVNAETPDILWGFIRRYYPDASAETQPLLARLVDHAIAYYQDFVRPAKRYRQPDATERAALEDLAATLAGAAADRRRRDHPERGLRGRQAPPVRRAAPLVRLPLPGAARPAGGPALRRLRRAVRHPGDDRADPTTRSAARRMRPDADAASGHSGDREDAGSATCPPCSAWPC